MTVQTTADSSDRREVLIRDNDLIRAVYSGTVTDSKILLQAMYDYQHSRSREPVIKYTTEEIAKLIGVKGTEKIYSILHAAVSRLLDHKVIITCESGKRKTTAGFNLVTFAQYDGGLFTIELNHRLYPYLVDLTTPYTAVDMKTVRLFGGERRSKNFALRLYEILKTKLFLLEKDPGITVVDEYLSLAELKIRSGLVKVDDKQVSDVVEMYGATEEALEEIGDPYPVWKDFKRRILDPAIYEIEEKTSVRVSYDPKRVGRSGRITGLTFHLRKKPGAAKETVDAAYNEAAEAADTSCDVRAVQEAAAENMDPVTEIRSFLKEDLTDDELMSLFITADENVERVKAAYDLACSQRGEIYSLMSWMTNAIKGRWADQPVVSRPGAGSGHGGNCGGWRGQDSHERRFGFKANEYDFDALEEELERQAFAEFGEE